MEFHDNNSRRNYISYVPHEMAHKRDDIRRNSDIVIPTRTKSNGADVRRRSIAGSTESRYLTVSTGSCHDYCKYGAVKIPKAFPKALRKRLSTTNSKKPSLESVVTEKNVVLVTKKGTLITRLSSFEGEDIPTEDSMNHRKLEQGVRHIGNIGARKSYNAQEGSSSGSNRSIVNHNGNKASEIPRSSYNLKGLCIVLGQNGPERVESEPSPSDEDVPEKIIHVIESSFENNAIESTVDSVRIPKTSALSHASVESRSIINSKSLDGRTGSSPSLAHSRSAGHLNQDNKSLRCTTLHGTRQSVSPLSSSSRIPILTPKSTLNELNRAKSQHGAASKTVESIKMLKVQAKATPRRSAIVVSGSQNSVPRKLEFQRGRVIEPQPESISPRRLKFRRASSAVEVQNKNDSITGANIKKKNVDVSVSNGVSIIKRASIARKEAGDRQSANAAIRKEVIGKKKVDDNQTNGAGIKRVGILKKEVSENQKKETKLKSPKVGTRSHVQVEVSPRKILRKKGGSSRFPNATQSNQEKVVLKHQEVQEKKDDQKSVNNVIEETASKLVETRKSKVKALVGAFETVISLQDTKQAAKTGAY